MAKEYIEREAMLSDFVDANDDKDWLVNQYNADWICSWIESQPVADVVEVVRCKECKHWDNGDCYKLELSKPNDFCSYGERREEKQCG